MKGCTISGSGTVGEGVFGVMTLGNELGRKEEANRWLSVEGLSSFPCLAPESLFCFDLRSIVLVFLDHSSCGSWWLCPKPRDLHIVGIPYMFLHTVGIL